MVTHGRMQSGPATKANFVCDNDINAIMRRMDADGDEEISFSDYFTTLLPYFIYGDLQKRPTMNQLVGKALRSKTKNKENKVKKLNKQTRAVSASAGQRRKPSYGHQNFFQKNNSLIQESDLDEDEYLELRASASKGNKHQMKESMMRSNS